MIIIYYYEDSDLEFQCKLGSETASMTSISSTDESFHYRLPQYTQQQRPSPLHGESPLYNGRGRRGGREEDDDESDADSKVSGSQLVDSCL